MKHIFIDTNIFLHFLDFEKIDWLKESSSECCKLIITPIVIDELDEKKIGTNRIGNLARKILNRFEDLSDEKEKEISKNIFFEIELSKPSKNIYEINDLNFDEQDHRLIASIIKYRIDNGIEDVYLCTNDVGPRLRAKQFQIKSLKLDSKYLLPVQISEEEKKIKKLEQENLYLKSRVPQLLLEFNNNKEFIKIPVNCESYDGFENFKLKKISAIKVDNPYLEAIDNSENQVAQIFSLSNEQIKQYNEKLDKFYTDYEIILNKIYEFENRENLTFEIVLILKNNGNIPAEDIDIHLHFPDGFELIESSNKKLYPILPNPPYKPKNRLDFGFSSRSMASPIYNNLPKVNLNFNNLTIKKTNSYDVDFHLRNLKHGYEEKLEKLSIIFRKHSDIKNFQIDYNLSAANIPEKIFGKLNIIFDK